MNGVWPLEIGMGFKLSTCYNTMESKVKVEMVNISLKLF